MKRRRAPHTSLAANVARNVLRELELRHPAEVSIDVLAHMRKALVDEGEVRGARAVALRVGERAIISVRRGLPPEQRRFAIAHELGHLELHPKRSYLGLCTDDDVVAAYHASGHEQEANAFAAELLMPEVWLAPACDVTKVSWDPIRSIAAEFQVSLTAAALRFVELCPERVALVCSSDRRVRWSWRGPTFGYWIEQGRALDPYSLAIDFWVRGEVPRFPETVSASAWVGGVDDDAELTEHAIAFPGLGIVMSLLWIKSEG